MALSDSPGVGDNGAAQAMRDEVAIEMEKMQREALGGLGVGGGDGGEEGAGAAGFGAQFGGGPEAGRYLDSLRLSKRDQKNAANAKQAYSRLARKSAQAALKAAAPAAVDSLARLAGGVRFAAARTAAKTNPLTRANLAATLSGMGLAESALMHRFLFLADIERFPEPPRPDLCRIVVASDDEYVPMSGPSGSLERWRRAWPHADVGEVQGGHVSASIFQRDRLCREILAVLERQQEC